LQTRVVAAVFKNVVCGNYVAYMYIQVGQNWAVFQKLITSVIQGCRRTFSISKFSVLYLE